MKRTDRFVFLTVCLAVSLASAACDDGSVNDSVPKSWGTPQFVESYNYNDAENPAVAVDGSGNALAVWKQRTYSGMRDILANRYVPGTGWGAAELIEDDDTNSASEPVISVNDEGCAVAVWLHGSGSLSNVRANRYNPESGWGTAELIETEDYGNAYSPCVAIDNEGNVAAAWHHYDDANNRYNLLSNFNYYGNAWQPGFVELLEKGTSNAFYPQIAFDDDGNAIAVWLQWNNAVTECDIHAARYVSGAGWQSDEIIDSDTGTAGNPQIAVSAGGNAVAVWTQGGSIWANNYEPGTGWGTAELIETESNGAQQPMVAIDGSGNATAVWMQYSGVYNVWANRYEPGTGWGTAARIDSSDTEASQIKIAVNKKGIAVAVWSQMTGTRNHIWSSSYVPGTGWGTAVQIQTDDVNGFYPAVAVDSEGNAIVLWEQNNGSRYDIMSCRYE